MKYSNAHVSFVQREITEQIVSLSRLFPFFIIKYNNNKKSSITKCDLKSVKCLLYFEYKLWTGSRSRLLQPQIKNVWQCSCHVCGVQHLPANINRTELSLCDGRKWTNFAITLDEYDCKQMHHHWCHTKDTRMAQKTNWEPNYYENMR